MARAKIREVVMSAVRCQTDGFRTLGACPTDVVSPFSGIVSLGAATGGDSSKNDKIIS